MLAEGPPSALLSEPCRARSSRFLHASSRHHEQPGRMPDQQGPWKRLTASRRLLKPKEPAVARSCWTPY